MHFCSEETNSTNTPEFINIWNNMVLVYLQQNCFTFIHLLWVNWTLSPHSIVKFYIIPRKVASLFCLF